MTENNEENATDTFLIEEYKEISSDLRHYGNQRSWQLTVFVALTGGLLSLLYGNSSISNPTIRIVFGWVGIVVTFCFFALDKRSAEYWNWCIERGKKIEKHLHLQRLSRGSPQSFFIHISARLAAWLIYGLAFVFWIIFLIWEYKICP